MKDAKMNLNSLFGENERLILNKRKEKFKISGKPISCTANISKISFLLLMLQPFLLKITKFQNYLELNHIECASTDRSISDKYEFVIPSDEVEKLAKIEKRKYEESIEKERKSKRKRKTKVLTEIDRVEISEQSSKIKNPLKINVKKVIELELDNKQESEGISYHEKNYSSKKSMPKKEVEEPVGESNDEISENSRQEEDRGISEYIEEPRNCLPEDKEKIEHNRSREVEQSKNAPTQENEGHQNPGKETETEELPDASGAERTEVADTPINDKKEEQFDPEEVAKNINPFLKMMNGLFTKSSNIENKDIGESGNEDIPKPRKQEEGAIMQKILRKKDHNEGENTNKISQKKKSRNIEEAKDGDTIRRDFQKMSALFNKYKNKSSNFFSKYLQD